LAVQETVVITNTVARRRNTRLRDAWRLFVASRYGVIGVALLALVTLTAIFAPLIAPSSPFDISAAKFIHPWHRAHPLGTDHLGRDVLSQIVYGARISLSIGLVAAGISAIVGVIVGSVAGYFGGWVDLLLSRITDMFLIIPAFFLIIIVVATLGSGILYVMVVIGLTSWPANARLMRSQVLTLRERTFVQALTALGESRWRILVRHIIPNGIQPVIANSTLQIAAAILIEAGLSFLGLGDPNQASWGRMIYEGRSYILTAWWTSVFAGIAIVITVMAFYLIGDGLAYVLSPRGRRLDV
jgi:peptide/nickel transport system permease protein